MISDCQPQLRGVDKIEWLWLIGIWVLLLTLPHWRDNRITPYDAFGFIGTTFRELERKTLIFFERAVPISPNAW
jgi:hypothetical protein